LGRTPCALFEASGRARTRRAVSFISRARVSLNLIPLHDIAAKTFDSPGRLVDQPSLELVTDLLVLPQKLTNPVARSSRGSW
jgi:hypothetical protein